jgi:hypothetical protein
MEIRVIRITKTMQSTRKEPSLAPFLAAEGGWSEVPGSMGLSP